MESVFQNAKWICLEPSSRDKNTVNPWETVIDETIRKTDLPEGGGIPVFYQMFSVQKPVKKCIVHITALGCFNLYMNGRKIGSDELMPGWTDYSKRVLYYSYDVTEFIEPANAVAVPVAPGWWAGRISMDTYDTDNNVGLICAIAIEYEDGETEIVNSDLTWKGMTSGRVRYADIWDGEVYDANYDSYEEISQASYPKNNLSKPAMEYQKFKGVISPKIGPSVCIRDFLDMKPVTAVIYDAILENESDYGEIRTIQTIEAPVRKAPIILKKGQTVIFDLGQNMVGWEHFTVKGNPHTTVTMRHAEMLNDSGESSRGNDGPKGSLYTANYRSAKAKGKYTLRGDGTGEEYRPSFTFYGFRYVELTATDDIEILDFYCDVVGSDNAETGFIETSNADVNRLFQNILWGQRSNYLSIPTDCPQRDERLGWTGDTQI